MDWRLIAAVAAAVGSFCFVAIGARIILSSPPPMVTVGAAPALVVVPAGPPPLTSLQQPPSLRPPGQEASVPAMSVFAPEAATASGREFSPPPSTNQSPRSRPEPAAGYKTAALRPNEEYALPAERPARPIIETKRPSVVPEIQTAPPAPHYRGVLTTAEISRIRHNLRLTLDQEPAWPRVEAALSEMGRQQLALIRQGKEPRISADDWPAGRLYSVAGPLLQSLRPDQKEVVRKLCRSLGFENVASML